MTTNGLLARVAGAPISWGVCEAPGWGHEIGPERVLTEMREVGLTTTELGPAGYLGTTPAEVKDRLAAQGLRLIGGFVPVPFHIDPALDLSETKDAIDILAAAGADIVVLAARSTDGSYDRKVQLDDDEWKILLANLARVEELIAAAGLKASLHPHVGTAVEDKAAVDRLLETSDIALTVDTGHLLIGGTDPVELVRRVPDRVAHVHLKDVDASVAAKVSGGEQSYSDAIRTPLYVPLGQGDVDVAALVNLLEDNHYDGWYVLEQDCSLEGEPAAGAGPIGDVRASIAFLAGLGR
jgi:inosose dehydratase